MTRESALGYGRHMPAPLATPFDDPGAVATEAARTIAHRTGVLGHDIAVVLGSGWADAADALGQTVAELSQSEVPGFPEAPVVGHAGKIRSIRAGDRAVLAFLGRTHLYQGLGVDATVHYVRTAAAAGCRALVVTNGCGGLQSEWAPGTPVLIRDHINLTGITPLRGATFIDLTQAYSPRLRALAQVVSPGIPDGVYVQFHGPQFETPAEIGMVRAIGGDLVGMSTAVEVIAAREVGLEVLGISLVTNYAAGMTGQPITSEEVLDTGHASATRVGDLLARLLPEV